VRVEQRYSRRYTATIHRTIDRTYAARARQAGSPVEFMELPTVEHFALIDPLSATWPNLLAALIP
jgi:acetyl esterase/lipase